MMTVKRVMLSWRGRDVPWKKERKHKAKVSKGRNGTESKGHLHVDGGSVFAEHWVERANCYRLRQVDFLCFGGMVHIDTDEHCLRHVERQLVNEGLIENGVQAASTENCRINCRANA